MGFGHWTRAGRGGVLELYVLEIGPLIRCEIRPVHRSSPGADLWLASNGRQCLGEFATLEAAAAALELGVHGDMSLAIGHYETLKAARPIRRRLRRY